MDIVGDYVIVIQHSAVTLFKKRKNQKDSVAIYE